MTGPEESREKNREKIGRLPENHCGWTEGPAKMESVFLADSADNIERGR